MSLLTLGCARNEVDSEELAGRLGDGGWELVDEDADVVVVNTCGFVEQAKKDSVDTLLAASDTGAKLVAVGCMAERYGKELADSLPEAAAVLGFDQYNDLAERLNDVLHGKQIESHVPVDRRTLLPITPVKRQEAAASVQVPGHGWGPTKVQRKRLDDAPVAPLKIASGCDRRCSFCAIPSFRGAFVSRHPDEIVSEAMWLAENGVKELFLVSENSTSYGKDLPRDQGALEQLLPRLASIPGVERVRVSYLQPAETKPSLVAAIAKTEKVANYFDMSFQHSSENVLRRMRRFGDTDSFLKLVWQIREHAPEAGIRSNFIVGFPGETEADLQELERFLTEARLDADTIAERVQRIGNLVEELTSQRAEDRVGSEVVVLIEHEEDEESDCVGRAEHQAPEVDGECIVLDGEDLKRGDLVRCRVVESEGVDLVVEVIGT